MKNYDIADIYNENKEKTGKTKVRHKDVLEKGEYILGTQAIILNSKNEILISKRAKNKEKYPLMWECNGGLVLTGETSLQGILREIEEELGIILKEEEAIFLKSVKKEYQFKDLYLFRKDIKITDLKFQPEETIDAKWIDIEEFMRMYQNGKIVPNIDFGREEYKQCLKLLVNNKF